MAKIACTNCHQVYPPDSLPYVCPACGGVFDWEEFPEYKRILVNQGLPGLWRYREMLGLPADAPLITLGEGNTPLVRDQVDGLEVGYKMESLNPSGSYKDRGSAILVSHLVARGVGTAVEDSSGNAGASFAAYAARSGLRARVFIPESASGPKRRQIEIYGADLVSVPGPRSAAADAVRRQVDQGAVYASHAYLPFGMAGIATIAYELVEQLGTIPGTVIAPVGHGSLLLGIIRGFNALLAAGEIKNLPKFVGVQSAACAPVAAEYNHWTGAVTEGVTSAEGVRVVKPVRKSALIMTMEPEMDAILAVEEADILPARDQLALRGIYVEPTSAIVWSAFKQLTSQLVSPVILVMSGVGYKFQK